jgi:tetratricopeptide (TPR) repeat protein
MSDQTDFFIAGGTLRARAPSYVTRPADQELYDSARAGEFCYVLTSRQMGKSSLMVRTARRLKEAGVATALIDLTSIGTVAVDPWYVGMLTRIKADLRLDVDPTAWWQDRQAIGAPQRFVDFLREVVLAQLDAPVVIFVDEIDSTLNLDFRDDFFAAIRSLYNARAGDPAFKRLTFVLLGVATPTDLIQDRVRTPFNIGRQIVLQEFSYADALPLREGLERCHPGQGDHILSRIFDWTSGHPYLTQKLCLAAAQQPATWNERAVDVLVEESFFSTSERKDTNLTFVQDRIRASPPAERRRMLKLYRRVYRGEAVADDDRSQIQNHLELFGLLGVEGDKLCVRNQIYRRVFDQGWIANNMPADRQRNIAIGAGILTLLLVAFGLYRILNPPTPAAAQAELCLRNFEGYSSSAVRLQSLACLFERGYNEQALRLFYERLSPGEQKYLFLATNSQNGPEAVTVVRGVYVTLDPQMPHSREMMDWMVTALVHSQQGDVKALEQEFDSWKRGRDLAAQGQHREALNAFSQVLLLNKNNPAALYDRAMAYTALGAYGEALADLDRMVEIANSTPTPTPEPTTPPTPTRLIATPSFQAVGTPGQASTPAIPPITPGATSSLTTTPTIAQPVIATLRFISADRIKQTVIQTILDRDGLQSYLRSSQTAFANLRAIPEVAAIAPTAATSQTQTTTSLPQPALSPTPTAPATAQSAILDAGGAGTLFTGSASKGDPIDPATSDGGSCIQGRVRGGDGSLFESFYVQVDNRGRTIAAKHLLDTGNYSVCGLGMGEWGVAVYAVNNQPTSDAERVAHQVRVRLTGTPGEIFYVNFTGSGEFKSPTSMPQPTAAPPLPTNTPEPTARSVTYRVDVVKISLAEITALPGCEQLATNPQGKTNNLCIVGPGEVNLQLLNLDSNGRFGPIPTDARQLYINEGQRSRILVVSDASQLRVITIGNNELVPQPGEYYKAVIAKVP